MKLPTEREIGPALGKPAAIWIKRDESGIVKVASVAEYTDAATLKKLREDGRKLELVSAETVTLNAPLPADVRVIQ